MKLIISFLLVCNFAFSQDYFNGKNLNCPSEDPEAMRLFNGGIELLHLNTRLDKKYLAINADIFAKAILKDTTFCDAYFFAGYTLSLMGDIRKTYAFYKVGEKRFGQPFLLYKMNIAATCMKLERYDEAREYYQAIVQNFPESPEGYYGIAATSPMMGDYKNGVTNVETAMQIYDKSGKSYGNEVFFLKAILYTLDKRYQEAIPIFERFKSFFKKDVNFNIYYSLSLLKTAQIKNDPKMKEEGLKYYKKVKDKAIIPDDVRKEFEL